MQYGMDMPHVAYECFVSESMDMPHVAYECFVSESKSELLSVVLTAHKNDGKPYPITTGYG